MRMIGVLALLLLAGCDRPPMPQTEESSRSMDAWEIERERLQSAPPEAADSR